MHSCALQTNLTIRLPSGRILGYAEYGDPDGVPILGFHGTPGSRFMLQLAHPVACELGVRLLAPERPGFGISSDHPGRTLAGYARDITDFADTLGLARFGVAGVSGGAPYAAACAALLPERVSVLGLISPIGPMAGNERPASIGFGHSIAFGLMPRVPPVLAAIFAAGRAAFLNAPNLVVYLIMSRAAASDWTILARPEVKENFLRGISEGFRPGIRAGLQEMKLFSKPWDVPLKNIQAPAFLWQGLADRNVSIQAALHLGELIPNCHTYTMPKAGHYWIFDNIHPVLAVLARAAKFDAAQPT